MRGPGSLYIPGNPRQRASNEARRFQSILDRFVGPVDKEIEKTRAEIAEARQARIREIKDQLGKSKYREYQEIAREAYGKRSIRNHYEQEQEALKAELSELESVNHVNRGVNHE